MTLSEIAMFKHFCDGHAITKLFISNYRNQVGRIGNPASIEDYLSNVEPHLVIKKAIKFYTANSPFDFDWWDNKNRLWLEYMDSQSMNSGYNRKQEVELHGLYAILRHNWDLPVFWDKEDKDRDVTRKRLGLLVADGNVIGQPLPQPKTDEDADELEFFDLGKSISKTNSRTLKDNEVTFNLRDKKGSLTFNKTYTALLREKRYKFCNLARTKSGDIILYLNNERGLNIYLGENATKANNVAVNSKDLCQYLKTLLNISEHYSVLHIEQVEATDEYMKLKIHK